MTADTFGVLLAGGQGRRMGRVDKSLILHRDKPLIQHCRDCACAQVTELVISANGDPHRFSSLRLPVVADLWPDHPGPLAGIISVMSWAQKARKEYAWLASFATDTPHFSTDMVARLHRRAMLEKVEIVYVSAGGDNHYTFGLWSTALLPRLLDMFNSGERALHRIVNSINSCAETFADPTLFTNINTPEDLQTLQNRRRD